MAIVEERQMFVALAVFVIVCKAGEQLAAALGRRQDDPCFLVQPTGKGNRGKVEEIGERIETQLT